MFYVYILQSKTNSRLYVGITANLRRRFKEHNAGQSVSTKAYIPWELIFYEAYNNKVDASRREGYFKTTQGRQAIRRMLQHHLQNHKAITFDYQGSTTG